MGLYVVLLDFQINPRKQLSEEDSKYVARCSHDSAPSGGWILVDISNHACFVKNGD
jgi:hypothetical protein